MMADEKNIFQKIGDAVVNYAPALAGVLTVSGVGAPAAGAVMALASLGKSFGLGSTASPETILSAVTADPEIALKAMIAENDFKLHMREADIDELKTRLADVQNARTRDTEIRKSGKKNVRADVLLFAAFTTVIVIYGICGYYGKLLSDIIIGSMLTAAGTFIQKIGTVFDFEFGSSRIQNEQADTMAASSARKTELLAKSPPIITP
jgi:hypothetical protein